ncbi:hypothetical protein BZG36_02647 [Bifiguratus adelaidae]|uniref:N-acetyltransferase domain-containing protein n=1 Tax=Bifiguratus adelaidae TaxID=1938954 RepID=A0A261Y2Z2_9FUNG|nr:hypothetical protein BZG36_02647 [Bifiguratus adelaidae]
MTFPYDTNSYAEPEILEGDDIVLVPLNPEQDYQQVYDAVTHIDSLFEWMPYGPFKNAEEYRNFLEGPRIQQDKATLLHIIKSKRDGNRIIGVIAYLNTDVTNKTIEVGHVCIHPDFQGSYVTSEATYLLARHAFDDLGYDRLWWKCNNRNLKSRYAAERMGLSFEGVLRKHMIVKGVSRDSAILSIIDDEWPQAKKQLEERIAKKKRVGQ